MDDLMDQFVPYFQTRTTSAVPLLLWVATHLLWQTALSASYVIVPVCIVDIMFREVRSSQWQPLALLQPRNLSAIFSLPVWSMLVFGCMLYRYIKKCRKVSMIPKWLRDVQYPTLSSEDMATALTNAKITTHRAILQVHAQLVLRQSSLEFKHSYNARSPPNQLPDEILSYIFQLSSHDWVPGLPLPVGEVISTRRSTNTKHTLGWIIVSHVCHRWRNVALSYSALWVNPAVWDNQAWIEEMIRRSGDTGPIDIFHFPSPDSGTDGLLSVPLHSYITKYIPLHFVRVRSLYVNGYRDELRHLFEACTDTPRSLQDLTIHCKDPHEMRFYGADQFLHTALVLPDIMTSMDIPLRHLALYMVFVQWSSPLFGPCLESLNIRLRNTRSRIIGTQYSPSTPDECLDALARMCSLKELTLQHAFPAAMNHRSSRLPVSLPRLRQIDFCGSVGNCLSILCCLNCPQIQHLKLKVTDVFPYDEDSNDLLSALALNMASFIEAVRDLRLQTAADSWLSYYEYSDTREDKALEVVLSGDSETSERSLEDSATAFVRFFAAFRCHSVRRLCLEDVSPCIPFQSWKDALEPMQQLVEIQFSGKVPTCFPALLSQSTPNQTVEGILSTSFILPKLDVIAFNSIGFRSPDEMINPVVVTVGSLDGVAYLDTLVSSLELRKQHGLFTNSVIFLNCRITKEVRIVTRRLESVVSSVIFDRCREFIF